MHGTLYISKLKNKIFGHEPYSYDIWELWLPSTAVHFAFESSHSSLWTFGNITWTPICY